jgi:hypothetical protein
LGERCNLAAAVKEAACAGGKENTHNEGFFITPTIYKSGQLSLSPAFQRQGVWPRPAKAYLIDTILADRPIPLLFFARSVNPKTGSPGYRSSTDNSASEQYSISLTDALLYLAARKLGPFGEAFASRTWGRASESSKITT